MPRKLFVLISLVLIVAFALTACATPATSAKPTDQPVPTVGPKTVITWYHITTAEEQKVVWQKLADEYMALHTDVTIEITVMENENFKTKMTSLMQAGDPPDIFQSWGGGTMNQYVSAGLLRDITAELDADGGAWRNSFAAPAALKVYSVDGKNYGVPWDMGMVGVWYNKALFTQAGIANTPTTWTELMAAVELLKTAGIVPATTGGKDKWPSAFIWEYLATRIGGEAGFLAAADRSGSFTDAPFVQAGEKLQEFIKAGAFPVGFLGDGWSEEALRMGNGEVAMDVMGQWGSGSYKDNSGNWDAIKDNIGWFPFPMVEGGAGDPNDALGGGNGFALGKNAEDAAVDFAKYLSRAESQDMCAAVGFCVPVIAGAQAKLTDANLIAILAQLAKAKYFQLYYDQYLTPALGGVVNDSVQALMQNAVDGTGLTPAEAAQAIEDSAKVELAKK
jgi:raffinose/stachyose/melibiose transport system substrate-binding protein